MIFKVKFILSRNWIRHDGKRNKKCLSRKPNTCAKWLKTKIWFILTVWQVSAFDRTQLKCYLIRGSSTPIFHIRSQSSFLKHKKRRSRVWTRSSLWEILILHNYWASWSVRIWKSFKLSYALCRSDFKCIGIWIVSIVVVIGLGSGVSIIKII